MLIKDGVTLAGLKLVMSSVLPLIEKVYNYHNLVMVVTSTTEEVPGRIREAHLDGRAVDLRAHQVNPYLIPVIVRTIRNAIGSDYAVSPVVT